MFAGSIGDNVPSGDVRATERADGVKYIIGVDFDNTLVSYDEVLAAEALRRGLIHTESGKGKKSIRDAIRRLPNGEIEWQRLQASIYGPRMAEAKPMEGIQPFFRCCGRAGARVFIVSHKTMYASQDESRTDLRASALSWMKAQRFFERDGLGLSVENVYFEPTRREKIERIRVLKCTHFIDDLEETFIEDSFPASVERILYGPQVRPAPAPEGLHAAVSWREIKDYIFGPHRS